MNNTIQIYADMHCHTTCSDGRLTPYELIDKAEKAGLQALAITDHDCIDAHHILKNDGYNGPVRVITGIEISCYEHGREVHMLGYHMRSDNKRLAELSAEFRLDRSRRAHEMVDRLQRIGVNISYAEVEEAAGKAPIGRPHVAGVLVRRGFVQTIQKAFDTYLDTGRPGYVTRSPYAVKDAVDLIHGAGGVASVAHPSKTYTDPRLFLSLMATGLDGIEVYHPSHWHVTREYYRVLALQHGLLITGGSDYHGTRDYDERNFGVFGVPVDLFERIEHRSLSNRIPE